jgi:hypothetical protein
VEKKFLLNSPQRALKEAKFCADFKKSAEVLSLAKGKNFILKN